MRTISAEEFDKIYGTGSALNVGQEPLKGGFNFEAAGDVFNRAGADMQAASETFTEDKTVKNFARSVGTNIIQGGLAPFRAATAGIVETPKGQDVVSTVVDKMNSLGETITPEVVQDKVGEIALKTIEGYEAMSPEEQLDMRNRLGVAEILSYFLGGEATKTVTQPVARGTEAIVQNVTKQADDVVKQAGNLRGDIQAIVGKRTVDPQLEQSVARVIDDPNFLEGSAGRVDDIVDVYDKYYSQSSKAIADAKIDPAIAVVGERIGDSFMSVINQQRQIGKQMGNELKEIGKLRVDIQGARDKLIEELAGSGLSYNPVTRQLNIFGGSGFADAEVAMLRRFFAEMMILGNAPTVRQIDNFLKKAVSEMTFAKGAAGVVKPTNAERIINSGLAGLRESLNPSVNGIAQLQKYYNARQIYSELADFIKEGGQYLGKITQSGDFARDASIAKSAVQSILNNGKKDWLLKLEELTGYKALDDSVIALQAMKDAGDYRGLSLLQAVKDSGLPTSKAGATSQIIDYAVKAGSRAVAGTPKDQTRAFLKSLASKQQNAAKSLRKADPKVKAPEGVPKTKEISKLESQIAKNVDQQRNAIKLGDFNLVEKLKKAYKILIDKLKKAVKAYKDMSPREKSGGYVNFGAKLSDDPSASVLRETIDRHRNKIDILINNGKSPNSPEVKAQYKSMGIAQKKLDKLSKTKGETPKTKKKPQKRVKIKYESEVDFNRYDEPKIKTVTVPKYVYHTTSPDNIQSIGKRGLIPNENPNFSNVGEGTFAFTEKWGVGPAQEINGRDIKFDRLRIKTDLLKSEKDIYIDTDMGGDIDDHAGYIWQIYKTIPPKYLDVEVGNKWVPIKEYIKKVNGAK